MKIKKEQFKKLIKECILELAKEGSIDNIMFENKQVSQSTTTLTEENNPYNFSNDVGQLSPNDRLKFLARATAQEASMGDPKRSKIMASIFEDTAKTTFQRMIQNDREGGDGVFIGEEVNPEEVRMEKAQLESLAGGHDVKRWAAVAFGKK